MGTHGFQQWLELSESQMLALATQLALSIRECPGNLYLSGNLGVGKTTFVRGLLRAMGYAGTVKSPTYSWLETYVLGNLTVWHWDLYRANSIFELEEIGMRDAFQDGQVLLVEWPERGKGFLPAADLHLRLSCSLESENRRDLICETHSKLGHLWIRDWFAS